MIARLIPSRRVRACPPVSGAKVYPGYTPGAADVVGSANTRTQACTPRQVVLRRQWIVPARSRHGRALLGTAPQARRARRSDHRGRVARARPRPGAPQGRRSCRQGCLHAHAGRAPRHLALGRRAQDLPATALRFAVDAGYIEISPVDRLSNELVGGAETSRDRVLTDEELRRLWQASSTHTPLLRFLVLTGQRIGEAQRATWSHVLGGRWHIPKEHSKNHRAHWVALSRQALALLRGQDQSREVIFGTATDTRVQAWLRRWCERERISPAFRPHDLRRTSATPLNTPRVLPPLPEKTLNHPIQALMPAHH